MGVTHLAGRSPELIGIWILGVIFAVVITILYIMYTSAYNKRNRLQMLHLGNAIGGLVLVTIFIAFVWGLVFRRLSSDAINIQRDATSLYVSRDNLLLNWTKADSSGNLMGKPISGNLAGDGPAGCYKNFALGHDPAAYDGYREYIATYQKGGTVKQYYEAPDGYPEQIYSADDDLENQRKLSLAYYRFLYCTKTYYQEIVNGDPNLIHEMPFLSSTVQGNLIARKSNCGLAIPDTQACTDGKSTQNCDTNACWTALNETIAAQCLLYDDHVYSRLNVKENPRGALAAMEIFGQSLGAPAGFQVKAPHR